MKDLIERLEKTTGPDRELDHLIAEAIFPLLSENGYTRKPDRYGWHSDTPHVPGANSIAPASEYTASIDAALTLVPAGHWWKIDQMYGPNSPMRGFGRGPDGMFTAACHHNFGEIGFTGWHDTPAIALCIAALKARSALPSPDRT